MPPIEQTDFLKRINTLALYQPFCEMLNATVNNAYARGWIYIATNGRRTYAEQDELYSHGRTKLFDDRGNKLGIVTNARGGESLHNFACAADFCRHLGATYDGHLQPDYADASFRVLAEEATKVGLEAGFYWQLQGDGIKSDSPHLQLPLKRYGITLARLRLEYTKGGYPAVFAYLDRYRW